MPGFSWWLAASARPSRTLAGNLHNKGLNLHFNFLTSTRAETGFAAGLDWDGAKRASARFSQVAFFVSPGPFFLKREASHRDITRHHFRSNCMMDAHEDEDGRQISGLAVHICEGCQGGYHSQCIRDDLSAGRVSTVSWSDPSLVERRSTWRCGDCVEDDRWGVRSLVESMVTFGTARCSAKSATYSVLTHFHADTTSPEACFLHGCVPAGADPHGNIKDESLVDDLRSRQRMRLAEGGDPHSKLHRLSELTPTTGKYWCQPDMTAAHHAATACAWEKRAPLSFRTQTAARGQAGSCATFETQLARARQQWLFVEPCMREPLMITPLTSGEHPHFKQPPPQGWSRECYAAAVLQLEREEAARACRRRQRVGLVEERIRGVGKRLEALLA